jgi:hypothetical protein
MSNKPNDEDLKNKSPLNKFKGLLDKGEEIGKDIANQGRERTEVGQKLEDLSRSVKNVLNILPNNVHLPGIEEAIGDWTEHIDQSQYERDSYGSTRFLMLNSTGGTSIFSSGTMFDGVEPLLSNELKTEFNLAVQGFYEVVDRSAEKEKVLELMRKFQLNKSFHGRYSSANQFEIAYDAMNRPVSERIDPANTSLIPMREAIETALDHLLFLRPIRSNIRDVEGPNKDWRKIKAIADQLKRDGVPKGQIQSWARDWQSLKKGLLSPAKTEKIDREEWRNRINKATIFVIGFLSGLDPDKLRTD